MNEKKKIKELYQRLIEADFHYFPPVRTEISVSTAEGVYIIYSPTNKVLHVGRNTKAKGGLNQRLQNHLTGTLSFRKNYLKINGINLREGNKFQCLKVPSTRKRALLEALAIGMLCPEYIGTGQRRGG